MWARVIECMLACWLAISPFIFRHTSNFLLINDVSCGALLVGFALLSFHSKLPKIHLCNLLIALWLLGLGFASDQTPLPAALQNHVILGFLIILFTLVPSESELSPRPWRRYLEKKSFTTDADQGKEK